MSNDKVIVQGSMSEIREKARAMRKQATIVVESPTPRNITTPRSSDISRQECLDDLLYRMLHVLTVAVDQNVIKDPEFSVIVHNAENFIANCARLTDEAHQRAKKLVESKKFTVKLVRAGAETFRVEGARIKVGIECSSEEFYGRLRGELGENASDQIGLIDTYYIGKVKKVNL